MGALASKLSPLQAAAGSVTEIITGRKRKREDEESASNDEVVLERSLNTPKRKKLLTTAQYIYQALFKEERSSDITVLALGKIWHLHKVYLCQSPYFASMFSGTWRESKQDFINIEIADPKITVDSLYVVFGSLYLDEVVLEPLEIVSILATATLFQLDGLIEKCAEVMVETTNAETAVAYYETGLTYGVASVKKAAFRWLLVNLLPFLSKHCRWLREINVDLMAALVSSPDLYVMQTEFSLYILLRFWMFLRLHPSFDLETASGKEGQPDPATYFARREDALPYLLTSAGERYVRAFRALRLQNLLNHHIDIKILKQDNIIPLEWLNAPLFAQWTHMLAVDHSLDKGPTRETIDEALFHETCVRCGRIIAEEGFQKWRWTGFNFGLDLVLITDTRALSIKRHHRTENERLLSLQVKRQFLIKVSLTSLNELRQVKHTQSTGIMVVALDKNEEAPLLKMDKEITYPLLISVSLLVVTPTRSSVIASTNTQTLSISEHGEVTSSSC